MEALNHPSVLGIVARLVIMPHRSTASDFCRRSLVQRVPPGVYVRIEIFRWLP